MAKHTKKAKINIPVFIACFLFCLTLISIHLTSGLYAKYISFASGSDSARVITFGDLMLTETGDFNAEGKLMIIPGVELIKKAQVDFTGSEAATYVFIEITSAEWQTADGRIFSINSGAEVLMQWSVAEEWNYLKNSNGAYVYYRALAPNTGLDEADVIGDDGKITVSEYITKSEMQTLTSVSIKLRAIAVQSGGFESPEAAWDSVSAREGSAKE